MVFSLAQEPAGPEPEVLRKSSYSLRQFIVDLFSLFGVFLVFLVVPGTSNLYFSGREKI